MPVRTPLVTALAAGLLATAVLGAAGTASHAAAGDGGRTGARTVEYFPDAHGQGRHVPAPASVPARIGRVQQAPAQAPAATAVTALQKTGPTDGRLDLVVIGDGYTAGQQSDFAQDAQAKLDAIFAVEPYKSYRGLFNFWLVNAVSNQSGVSGDPAKGDVKDTAVSSYFFCSDTERLLCVDEKKVDTYARQAPASDIVFVIANSTKYGGAGYSGLTSTAGHTGIATMSSDNDRSYLIGAHELGHSIGLLADEYQYDGYGTYPGAEPAEPNTTKQSAAGMESTRTKWYRWLGQDDPSGGTVGAYEGAGYYEYGIYRPTQNSIMRSLDTEAFNLPGREAMIAGFYRAADLLTSAGTLRVDLAPLPKGLADVRIRWSVDGVEVPAARGRHALKAASLGLRKGTHRVTASAVDHTVALRDPAARRAATDRVTWTIRAKGPRP
ncbi:M64 family metallopeptidase [Streptomyces sp. NPDC006552]|uniref:M64 family metallopeptidase n=1 Tax=Streptomyces sp. NPDC006552 TaxID=3157179 RepID=UPI0033AE9CCF